MWFGLVSRASLPNNTTTEPLLLENTPLMYYVSTKALTYTPLLVVLCMVPAQRYQKCMTELKKHLVSCPMFLRQQVEAINPLPAA
jgi:hypothetical protein